MDVLSKSEKLHCLHELAGKVVDAYVFDQHTSVDALVYSVLSEEERESLLQQQELTPTGKFPCRFPGCEKSFKYNGKSRRSHELKHDPPVQVEEQPTITVQAPLPTKQTTSDKDAKQNDDVYNYNCALLTDCFLFFNFLKHIFAS